jgi:hypothetical protein
VQVKPPQEAGKRSEHYTLLVEGIAQNSPEKE